jgi:GNAT superfamily N-acetyltransferase
LGGHHVSGGTIDQLAIQDLDRFSWFEIDPGPFPGQDGLSLARYREALHAIQPWGPFDEHVAFLARIKRNGGVGRDSARQAAVSIRPYMRSDCTDVFRLLWILPILYPHGYDWLDRRLIDVEEGRADCRIATVDGVLAGALIETPKGARSAKLSTLWVVPRFRHRGVAGGLLEEARCRWLQRGFDLVTATVDWWRSAAIAPTLERAGFRSEGIVPELYGPNRDELIMVWRPSTVVATGMWPQWGGSRL